MTATRNDPQRKRLEDHTEPIIGISAPDHGNHPFYHSLDSKLVDKATHWNQTRAAGQSFLRKPRLRSDSPDAPPTHLFFLHTSQVPCFSGRFRLFHDQKSTRFRGVRTGRSSDYPSVFSLLARSRMMIKGEGFKKRIENLIDARLHSLVNEIAIKTTGAGPGRGHKGRSHEKISLSLPKPLYVKVRGLEGFFSCHVASALELYLKLQKG